MERSKVIREGEHELPLWEAGSIIADRYAVIRVLGKGGMGIVYAVEDRKLQGKLRAIKITPLSVEEEVDEAHSITAEAGMLVRLNHPNLPHIVDAFLIHKHSVHAVVMDFIHGETLAVQFQKRQCQMLLLEVVQLGLQLCSALNYLHRQRPQIIHRDLKPSNVMVEEEGGYLRLIDFGIARQVKAMAGPDTQKLGTPGFAAPEQYQGSSQRDPRTDVYGLGALLYYLASGGELYQPLPVVPRLEPHFQWKGRMNAESSLMLANVLSRMLAYRLEERTANMEQVERELLAIVQLAGGDHVRPAFGCPNRQGHVSAEANGVTIALLSLSPGAGATFAAITLAKLLGQSGVSCIAAEFPSNQSEWHALLPSQYASGRLAFDNYWTWQEGAIQWLAQEPARIEPEAYDLEKWELFLNQQHYGVKIVDYSSFNEQAAGEWLSRCQLVCIVADPFPAKWQQPQLRRLQTLQQKLNAQEGRFVWLANKDNRFVEREQWLQLLPNRPVAVLPMLPAAEWLNGLWSGKWVTEDKRLGKPVKQAFNPLLELIGEMVKKGKGK
ncbi:serine/threonine-protein kinase [Paenibacillus sp. FSL H8-0537]|uniref:serine/threonine protein kinase n=1 Tax=Paenibacillus sp. FSL H8-0537 TaxID=2921399 RepID=UPI003100FCA0